MLHEKWTFDQKVLSFPLYLNLVQYKPCNGVPLWSSLCFPRWLWLWRQALLSTCSRSDGQSWKKSSLLITELSFRPYVLSSSFGPIHYKKLKHMFIVVYYARVCWMYEFNTENAAKQKFIAYAISRFTLRLVGLPLRERAMEPPLRDRAVMSRLIQRSTLSILDSLSTKKGCLQCPTTKLVQRKKYSTRMTPTLYSCYNSDLFHDELN